MKTIENWEQAGKNEAGLTPRQEAAALALASGDTLSQAAEKANCGVATICNWQNTKPAFKARIAQLREVLTERTLGLLASAGADAVLTLLRLLRDKSAGIRHKSADSILNHGVKMPESNELRKQIAEVRERLAALDAATKRKRT